MIIQNSHTNDNFESFVKSKTFKNNEIWYNVRIQFSNHRHQHSHHTLVMCSNLALKYVKFVVMIAPNAQFLVWPYSSCVYIQRKNLSGPHNDGLITDQTRRNNYRLNCIISLDFKNIADIWAGWLSLLLSGLCKYRLDIYNNMVTDIVSTFQIFHTCLVLLLFKINLKEKNTQFFLSIFAWWTVKSGLYQ